MPGTRWNRYSNPTPCVGLTAFAGLRSRNACSYRELIRRVTVGPAKMDQWVSNLSPFEIYLVAAPAKLQSPPAPNFEPYGGPTPPYFELRKFWLVLRHLDEAQPTNVPPAAHMYNS